jgi:hypothetical protein
MEELRWQQNDSAYDPSHDHTSTSRRKIVSFCKSLCRIFDHTATPYQEVSESGVPLVSSINETVELLRYKHRILCFMNRLMQRYGKRAVECFLGTSTHLSGSSTSSRKSLNYVGYKQVLLLPPLCLSLDLLALSVDQTLPSICRLCVSTIQSLEQIPQEDPSRTRCSSQRRELEVYLVHAVSKFFLNIEQSLQVEVRLIWFCFIDSLPLVQNSSLKRLIESSKSSELVRSLPSLSLVRISSLSSLTQYFGGSTLVSPPLPPHSPRAYHDRLPVGIQLSDVRPSPVLSLTPSPVVGIDRSLRRVSVAQRASCVTLLYRHPPPPDAPSSKTTRRPHALSKRTLFIRLLGDKLTETSCLLCSLSLPVSLRLLLGFQDGHNLKEE